MRKTRPLIDRFEEKVIECDDTGCWLWAGSRCESGYGRISVTGSVPRLAHRVSYSLFVEYAPKGMDIDHTCKNRSCVNPEHLECVSHAENMARIPKYKTHCKNDHAFDEDNTYTRKNGWKSCRQCARDRRKQ